MLMINERAYENIDLNFRIIFAIFALSFLKTLVCDYKEILQYETSRQGGDPVLGQSKTNYMGVPIAI